MNELYNTNLEDINQEIENTKNKDTTEILNIKLELLQIYHMCYSLYKDSHNSDILKKLIIITNLLKKCKAIENAIVEPQESNKRILSDLNKKRHKKIKNNNPRKKYKEKNEKLSEKCNKKFDGNIY